MHKGEGVEKHTKQTNEGWAGRDFCSHKSSYRGGAPLKIKMTQNIRTSSTMKMTNSKMKKIFSNCMVYQPTSCGVCYLHGVIFLTITTPFHRGLGIFTPLSSAPAPANVAPIHQKQMYLRSEILSEHIALDLRSLVRRVDWRLRLAVSECPELG